MRCTAEIPDYISADQNETDTPDEAWILYPGNMLDNEKNAPMTTANQADRPDEACTRNIAEQMVDNSVLRNAVDVIACTTTFPGDSLYSNLLNEAYGKEIW